MEIILVCVLNSSTHVKQIMINADAVCQPFKANGTSKCTRLDELCLQKEMRRGVNMGSEMKF